MTTHKDTEFPHLERDAPAVIIEQAQGFAGQHCGALLDSLPTMILVLNRNLQIVFANEAAVAFLGRPNLPDVLGRRPGEAFCCVNAPEGADGCGTSRHCRKCDVVRTILAALSGASASADCVLLRREQTYVESVDIHVRASVLAIGTETYVMFAMTDASHESRRRSMERIFFHDVLNLAGGIRGLAELMLEQPACAGCTELPVLHDASRSLVDEIVGQRELLAAENNELRPVYAPVNAQAVLRQLAQLYSSTPAAQGQHVVVQETGPEANLVTDARLVQRVLGNMLKNALEAGLPGDTVTVSCGQEEGAVVFRVHNAAVMADEVRDSIFHRCFSTKGAGRGEGTYSMLLLAERYLGGRVDFTSAQGQGTTFRLLLPKRPETT